MSVDFENKVPFGKKADDRLYDVDEVENGRACDCHCPYCGVLLVAKHGDVNRHHFAHYGAPSCEYGFEAGVRLAVKEVLDRRRQIRLPAVVMDFGENLRDVTIRPEQVVELDDVALVDEGTRLPDLVVGCGGRRLYIDVQLTKGMNSNRLQALRDQGIGVLQLSMSHLDVEVRMKDVEELVVDSLTSKNWLSHYKVLKGRDWIEKRTEHMRVWQGSKLRLVRSELPEEGRGEVRVGGPGMPALSLLPRLRLRRGPRAMPWS
jgi:hypothetical protein